MSAKKNSKIAGLASISFMLPLLAVSQVPNTVPNTPDPSTTSSLTRDAIARQLGWVESTDYQCGGYYLDEPFHYAVNPGQSDSVEVTSNQTLFSQHGTSILEGKVTATRLDQQMTANKAYLYRDPTTGKLSALEMFGDVHLREPNTLVVAKKGRYNFETKNKALLDILYRTTLNTRQIPAPEVTIEQLRSTRVVSALTAWGKADEFSSTQPKIYELSDASFTTCPPINPTWRVKAGHIVLDKNTGRGHATNARIIVKGVPVFYFPYIDFSIDGQRKSGFLWPTAGGSNKAGYAFYTPFYWNMAPNYDMTLTPGILSKRGVRLSDNFRYLTEQSHGNVYLSVLPDDRFFAKMQSDARTDPNSLEPADQNPSITQAETNRLINASDTRKGLIWRDESQFTDHWSSHVDFNYAGDDYYLRDFGNLNEITQNQLLQEGDVYYKSQNWNFTGRLQAYQTLHPVNELPVLNQYRRFPQLILNVDYPDQKYGLEYFINSEATHFDILNNPGTSVNSPIGNRLHAQPGVSLPVYLPYFYFVPRAQLALTDYNLYQTTDTATPNSKHRALPIFDISSGLNFIRFGNYFGHGFSQTLEPQLFYSYIPYRNQSSIPEFDTTVNTLTYDQIFNYNRFTGIDRIGDANQLGFGVATRLIDQESGLEKVRLGVGDIIYFENRRVTLCNSQQTCTDYPDNPENHYRLSPVSGIFEYHVNRSWRFSANTIWNPITKQVDNSAIAFNYEPDLTHIFNVGYSFVRNGDYFSGINVNTSQNNLKLTDISFAWPVIHDISAVGRWSQDWHTNHFQNLLYGLQYDTCCWAVRAVGGRSFTNLNPANSPQYNSEFYLQFALKGLGNVGSDPSGALSTGISGYNTQFGQVLR